MDRAHWKALAEQRVLEAGVLIEAELWSGAYHIAGYSMESGLKACVLAHIENNHAHEIFLDRKFSENCWTHNLNELVRLAGLRAELDLLIATAGPLRVNWSYVSQWKEISRYQFKSEFDARRLYYAVIDPANGVLPWIRTHW